jgi:putative transposase
LRSFAERPLDEAYPYLILDARYERVREGGVVGRRAVLIAIGINHDGRRCVLGVDLANRESKTSWRDFLVRLIERGLHGVEFVVSDDHEGLKQAAIQTFAGALWQRCYVHFLRNALDHLPRKKDNDCIIELRWIYERRTVAEAQADIASWLKKWQGQFPRLCDWVEENALGTCHPPCHPLAALGLAKPSAPTRHPPPRSLRSASRDAALPAKPGQPFVRGDVEGLADGA